MNNKYCQGDIKYWVAFSSVNKIGPVRFNRLKSYFKYLERAWTASSDQLTKAGLESEVIKSILEARNLINPDLEMEKLDREGIKVVCIDDKEYPELLKEIYNPPYILYYKGRLPNANECLLAVVGSRKVSYYGRQITSSLVKDLSSAGLIIVSGLAMGIDTIAHESTVKAGGKTIAVLGTGLDRKSLYPAINQGLSEEIIGSGGALVSEFPMYTLPLKGNFPARNRIISGLSYGTLVVEAGEKSGSLITAQLALEQNREVFAVPGSIISQNSIGTNNLIKQGAKLILNANDVLEALNFSTNKVEFIKTEIKAENDIEKNILNHLSSEPTHIDLLKRETKLDISQLSSALIFMEMQGKIKNIGNMHYVISR